MWSQIIFLSGWLVVTQPVYHLGIMSDQKDPMTDAKAAVDSGLLELSTLLYIIGVLSCAGVAVLICKWRAGVLLPHSSVEGSSAAMTNMKGCEHWCDLTDRCSNALSYSILVCYSLLPHPETISQVAIRPPSRKEWFWQNSIICSGSVTVTLCYKWNSAVFVRVFPL